MFNRKIFGFSLAYSYLSPLVKVLSLENKKKNSFSFCILLAYSYLCNPKRDIEVKNNGKQS